MCSDIVPGAVFPDYELPDHTGTLCRFGELQGDDPLILTRAGQADSHRPQPGTPRSCRTRASGAARRAVWRSTPPTSNGCRGSSTSCPRRSTMYLSRAPVPTMPPWRSSTSKRHVATSTPICCHCMPLGTPRARFAQEGPCSSWVALADAARRRGWPHLASHGRDARLDEEPRARARAHPCEPHCGRVRRHAAVRRAPR